MRCPKCGFISFDHMDTCRKCKKDIAGKVEVEGTTYHATAPSFLKFPGKDAQEDDTAFVEDDLSAEEETFEFADPDLNVLVDEEEEFSFEDDDDAVISFDDADLESMGDDFQLEADDVDGEVSFELDMDDDEMLDGGIAAPDLSVPDELSDISDLAPPDAASVTPPGDTRMSLSLDDEMDQDEDLDLDGLDLDLGLGGNNDGEEKLSLSLDDIDISMDDESDDDFGALDMSLDLGDFDAAEAENKKTKPVDGLGDISLSLD